MGTATAPSAAKPAGRALVTGVPPGPRAPVVFQTAAVLLRQREYMERQRRRFGPVFTLRIAGFDHMMVLSEPELIKQVFTADPTVLHAGDRSPLRRVLGSHSLLGIDEERHLEQRR